MAMKIASVAPSTDRAPFMPQAQATIWGARALSMRMPVGIGIHSAMPIGASIATAMQVVNAIPAVCAAPPGIATMADLPLIRSHVGFGNT